MAEPLVVQLAEGFRTQLAKRDASALQAMSSQWGKVEAALANAINTLSQELVDLKAKGEDIPQWKLFQMERYQSLLAQIGAEMAKYSQYAIAQLKDETDKSQRLAQAHAKMMLAGITNGRSLKTALDKLPVEAVESITAIAQAGQPLNKLLQAAYPTAVAGLTNELIYGLSIGRNPRETARAMMKQGLSQGLNHILLVARDQQIRHYREMTRLQYGRNGAIYGYMRLAARNTRTCLACIALDGSVYPTDGLMELHPQDRCTMIPLVEGFPLPQWQRGLDWFKTLPDEEKKRMMGNGRFEAYKEGLFTLDQLVTVKPNPVWGPSAQVTSLAELLKGRGGGAPPLDPAALLATHQSKVKPQKPKTLAVDDKDKALLEALTTELDKNTKLDIATRKAMKDTLAKILSGQKGYIYTDENGRLSGVLSYAPSKSNLQYLNITGAGFVDAAANRRAIVDIAQTAQQHKQGVELYVPNHLHSLYKGWGFLMHQSFQGGARMQLLPDDVPGFLKNPDTFGEQKTAELANKAKAALLDPQAGFTFRVGQEIEGLGFKPVKMAEADFAKQTKPLAYEPPLGNLPADKHAAAGMLLFTPDGKLVLVDPANQYGGYKTTFPKGTQEEGMGLQETAVKEVWEESGFKAKILGHLGDYEKTTSVTRFYVGVVEEGAPWAAHYETEAVRIVPFNQADKYLNVGTDKHILSDLRKLHKDIFGSDAFSVAKLEAGLDERAAQKAAEAAPPPGQWLPHSINDVDAWGKGLVTSADGPKSAQWGKLKKAWTNAGLGDLDKLPALFDADYKGLSLKPKEIYFDPEAEGNAVKVTAVIYDANQKEVGEMTRWFYLDTLTVYHSSFHLKAGQTTGLGTAWEATAEATYKAWGFKQIKMEASNTVGGYAWARMGFNFDPDAAGNWGDKGKVANIFNKLTEIYTKRYGTAPENISKTMPPWEIAALTGPDGYKIGKEALLNSTWDGIKVLADASPGYQVGQAYFAAAGIVPPPAPPPPPAPAAEPLAAWTKYSIDGLGQLSATEAKLALEFAQDKPHLLLADEKQALAAVANTAVSAAKLPPPPGGPPTALSKKALVDHLATIRGIAKWKLSVMTKEQVAALFDMPEADALAAIEAGGAAHTAKYAGAKKTAVPAATQTPAPLAAYQKFQAGDMAVLSAEETLAALEYAKAQGYSVVIKDKLQEAYQEKIGDPLIKTKAGTKAAMVAALNQETGLPIYLLNQLNKAQLVDLVGQPMSLAYAAVGKPFVAKASQPLAVSSQLSAVSRQPSAISHQQKNPSPPAPPSSPLPPQPSWPDDLAKAGSQALAQLAKNAEAIFPPGSPANKGVAKAITNIQSGNHSGFAYLNDKGQVEGLVAFSVEGGLVKVSGAAFGKMDTNLTAMADVANKALTQGLPLKVYAPKDLVGLYKKWGFEEQGGAGNGSYMLITPDKIPGLVTAAGKVVAKAPEKPPSVVSSQPSAVSHQPSSKAPIGLPGGATTQYDAAKLPKEQLVTYMVGATGLTAEQVEKFSKLELVKFMKLTPQQAVAAMQSAKFVETAPTAQTAQPPKPTPPKIKERPLPANLPAFKLPDPPGFPTNVKALKEVRGLGGSTGAKLVQDPATGKQYVMKKGKSAAHLLEEAYADAAYQAAGFNVPTYKVYETAEGPVKLAEFRKGKTLEEFMKSAAPADRQKVLGKLRQGFAMDALMGNWDVVGASLDNVLVDDEGEIWRIDNGGSLRYRAQGDKKEKEFLTDYPVELWTMRDKAVGPKNAQIFGQLGIYEIMEQAREMVGKSEAILGALPEDLRPMVNSRLAVMRDLVNTSDTLKADTFQEGYADGFLKHSTYIRREGIIDRLPQKLTQKRKGSTTVYDENGREFDDLRGENSIVKQVSAYINANGGNVGAIQHWMSQQAGSSWSEGAQAFKYYLAKKQGGQFDRYFWGYGVESARQSYEKAIKVIGEEEYDKTRMMWHAFVYESLRQMEFKGKTADGHLELMRTESTTVTKLYKLKPGQRNIVIQRGACESASIYKSVVVAGAEMTLQKVPLHRIIGYYFAERPNTDGGSAFLGDGENEFVFMPDGIPFDYVGSTDSGRPAEDYWKWQ